MHGYAEQGIAEASYTERAVFRDNGIADLSARGEQVKRLDDALSRLEDRLEMLTQRLAPALRSSDQVKGELVDKMPTPSESDVVAHLRHTQLRVNRNADALSELIDRIDL